MHLPVRHINYANSPEYCLKPENIQTKTFQLGLTPVPLLQRCIAPPPHLFPLATIWRYIVARSPVLVDQIASSNIVFTRILWTRFMRECFNPIDVGFNWLQSLTKSEEKTPVSAVFGLSLKFFTKHNPYASRSDVRSLAAGGSERTSSKEGYTSLDCTTSGRNHASKPSQQIGRAHVWTPVTL